ncbi:unnamed protein product, partial [Amoebophrya sp. A25]
RPTETPLKKVLAEDCYCKLGRATAHPSSASLVGDAAVEAFIYKSNIYEVDNLRSRQIRSTAGKGGQGALDGIVGMGSEQGESAEGNGKDKRDGLSQKTSHLSLRIVMQRPPELPQLMEQIMEESERNSKKKMKDKENRRKKREFRRRQRLSLSAKRRKTELNGEQLEGESDEGDDSASEDEEQLNQDGDKLRLEAFRRLFGNESSTIPGNKNTRTSPCLRLLMYDNNSVKARLRSLAACQRILRNGECQLSKNSRTLRDLRIGLSESLGKDRGGELHDHITDCEPSDSEAYDFDFFDSQMAQLGNSGDADRGTAASSSTAPVTSSRQQEVQYLSENDEVREDHMQRDYTSSCEPKHQSTRSASSSKAAALRNKLG